MRISDLILMEISRTMMLSALAKLLLHQEGNSQALGKDAAEGPDAHPQRDYLLVRPLRKVKVRIGPVA